MAASWQEHYYAQSFPAFGVERRGAPVLAFTKIDSSPILDRSQVYEPDAVVVLDARLLQGIDVTAGLKPGGQVIINCDRRPPGLPPGQFECLTVNATAIALEYLGRPIVNTAMAGALCAVLGFLPLNSIKKAIAETLPSNLVEINIKVAEVAYHEVISGKKGALIA
jgi:pyruvate ferredoxin oxidoreductase gamma subunit